MHRRTFVAGMAAVVVTPLAVEAQVGKVYRIGWLSTGSFVATVDPAKEFREALRDLGYTEGVNVAVEFRFAEGRSDRLRDSAEELAHMNVDAVVALGTPASIAAKNATRSIPIIMLSTADPVGSGLVRSLARPGGNVTGLSAAFTDIAAKWVELLREIVPGISRIGFLGNRDNPVNREITFRQVEKTGRALGLTVQYFSATKPSEVRTALTAIVGDRVQGVIVPGDAVIRSQRQEIAEFLAAARLPAVYFGADYIEAGGLLSYGPDGRELGRRAAVYADRIFKGAKPADLPVEEPTKFELVLNLKTARALGLTIPPSLLLRADQVIE